MNIDYDLWVTYALALIILYMLIRVFLVPIRYVLRGVYHLVLGGVVLWFFNLAGSLFEFHLALNPVTALIVGYLGAPGLALLTILQTWVLA